MHRMEALLGGLLNNDDPRAQALLEEYGLLQRQKAAS